MRLSDYRKIWCVDTEFIASAGERPLPVCYCAIEARTGEERLVWLANGGTPSPPIPLGDDILVVAYSARAELGVHLALGWPLPLHVLDLHVEHLRLTNGRRWESCKLTALRRHLGLAAPAEEHKDMMRARIMAGPPFDSGERASILAYCMDDARMLVDPLHLLFGDQDVSLAVTARGGFMQVAASLDHAGLPIDQEIYNSFRLHLPVVWRHFVSELDNFGLYEDGHFRHGRLDQLVKTRNLNWPRTARGQLKTDEETWQTLAELYPGEIGPYSELRHIASWLRGGLDLCVGRDGRSRPRTFPFLQKTGRTSPSGSFIFSHPKWLRGLLRPLAGTVLLYTDFAQQEPALAGYLSRDNALQRCYHSPSGSFYVTLMIECGLAPGDATKQTHPRMHSAGKVLLLAITYGAGVEFVAARLRVGHAEAEEILFKLKRTFPVFFKWREEVLLKARFQGYIETPDGWRQAVDSRTNPRSLYNFPMQACGAAMTRCAAILASKAGLRVIGTVHDAILCEADIHDVDAKSRLEAAMNLGADLLAPGFGIRHEIDTFSYPDRYYPDESAARMFWNRVMGVVACEDGRDPTEWLIQEQTRCPTVTQ